MTDNLDQNPLKGNPADISGFLGSNEPATQEPASQDVEDARAFPYTVEVPEPHLEMNEGLGLIRITTKAPFLLLSFGHTYQSKTELGIDAFRVDANFGPYVTEDKEIVIAHLRNVLDALENGNPEDVQRL